MPPYPKNRNYSFIGDGGYIRLDYSEWPKPVGFGMSPVYFKVEPPPRTPPLSNAKRNLMEELDMATNGEVDDYDGWDTEDDAEWAQWEQAMEEFRAALAAAVANLE